MSECYADKDPFFQCCCGCRYHLVDRYHCATHPEMRDAIEKKTGTNCCICSIPKGFICAGFAMTEGGSAHSEWPAHSIGCEMYTPKVVRGEAKAK